MAAIAGQPAPKPGSVDKPVPGKSAEEEANAFLADYSPPSVSADVSPADAEANAFLSSVESPAATDSSTPPGEDQFAPEPDIAQANMDQFSSFMTRLQAGLAANDTEKMAFLRKKFGPQNATVRDGKLYFRKAENEKFKRLDPDTFELVNDLIPDFAREIVTEAAMVPGEVAGGMATGPAAPLGVIAGRVASVPMANEFANRVAEQAGVPQDPNRNIRQENLFGMGAEAVMPVIGSKIAKGVARFVPGTQAYRFAREAGEREAVALSKQSQEVVQSLQDLSRTGVDIPMMSHQIHPDSPSLLAKAAIVEKAMPGQFANKQMQVAEGYGEALTNHLSEIARRSGSGPVKSEALPAFVTNAVHSLEKSEGKAIAEFRNKAAAKLKNEKVPIPPEIRQQAASLMKEYGFKMRPNPDGKSFAIIPPSDMRPLIKGGMTSVGEVRAFVNALNNFAQAGKDGTMKLVDMERMRGILGESGYTLSRTSAGAGLSRMASGVRQFYRQTIERGLDDDFERQAFNKVMDDFSTLRRGTEQLKNVLRDDVTTKTMVQSFFRGKENLANIKAIKSIAGDKSPEWESLREEFINQLALKHRGTGLTGFNSKGFMDDLEKNYGKEFITEIVGEKNFKQLKDTLTVGKRIEAMTKDVKADQIGTKQEKAIGDKAVGFFADIKFKMINGAMSMIDALGSRENAAMEIFNRNGYEKYVQGYKGSSEAKKEIARKIEAALQIYNSNRAAQKAAETGKKAIKATIREDVMR